MDVRIVTSKPLWNHPDVIDTSAAISEETGARISHTEDVAEGVDGVDFLYTDVWVSMGEPAEVWEERIGLLKSCQVNADVVKATGNPPVKFMHCLPAFHDRHTKVGEQLFGQTGMDALEVTDDVFGSLIQSCSTRRRAACTQSRLSSSRPWAVEVPILVALGGNGLLERGQNPDVEVQEANVRRAVDALAPLAEDHELVVTPGHGPEVGRSLAAERVRPPPHDPLPLRHPGSTDPGNDRLLAVAGNAEPPARTTGGSHHQPDPRRSWRIPAFHDPTKFVSEMYSREQADQLRAERGWSVKQDGNGWRRVVGSHHPRESWRRG